MSLFAESKSEPTISSCPLSTYTLICSCRIFQCRTDSQFFSRSFFLSFAPSCFLSCRVRAAASLHVYTCVHVFTGAIFSRHSALRTALCMCICYSGVPYRTRKRAQLVLHDIAPLYMCICMSLACSLCISPSLYTNMLL